MRTVTFSDSKVAAFVNKKFVPVWHKRGPGFHNDNYQTEKWIFQSAFESYPTKNICSFFLRPDGKTFFYAAGYYAPDFYLEILRAALQTASHSKKVLNGYAQRCDELVGMLSGKQKKNAAKLISSWCRTAKYDGVKHNHSVACAGPAIAGYSYLARVFRWFASAEKLPNYSEIERDYLNGNSFTEESRDGVASVDSRKFEEKTKSEPSPKRRRGSNSKLAVLDKKLTGLREDFQELNDHLLEISLDAPDREECQKQLLRLLDQITACSSRRRVLAAK